MLIKKVGDFELSVSSPFPMWIEITHPWTEGRIRFSHRELADLAYAIECAKFEVARELPNESQR